METATFNQCKNWCLFCTEQKEVNDGQSVLLKCEYRGIDTNGQPLSVVKNVSVFADITGKCEIEQDDYSNSFIVVDGMIQVGNYTDSAGEVYPTLSINAQRVVKGTSEHDECVNWGLYCFEQKLTKNEKSVFLKCSLSGKDKDKNYLPRSQFISVFADITGKCQIEQDEYGQSLINVDGWLHLTNYVDKNGNLMAGLSLSASRVEKKKNNN